MEQGDRIEAAVAYETKVLFFLMATAFSMLIQWFSRETVKGKMQERERIERIVSGSERAWDSEQISR